MGGLLRSHFGCRHDGEDALIQVVFRHVHILSALLSFTLDLTHNRPKVATPPLASITQHTLNTSHCDEVPVTLQTLGHELIRTPVASRRHSDSSSGRMTAMRTDITWGSSRRIRS